MLGYSDLCKYRQNFPLHKRAPHELIGDAVVENKHCELSVNDAFFPTLKALQHGIAADCVVLCESAERSTAKRRSAGLSRSSPALLFYGNLGIRQRKVCLTSFPAGRDWSNVRSSTALARRKLTALSFLFRRLLKPLMVQLYPNRETEEGEGHAMADGNPRGGENCVLHFGTRWRGQLCSNLVCLQIGWGLFATLLWGFIACPEWDHGKTR